jgi:nucleoside-triphosphatase THEP1
MLLIAVTGPPGAGKTTLLATLAAWSETQGRSVDGFVARAHNRSNPHMGAARYDLEWVADGRVTPFAHRAPKGTPAYIFDEAALAEARAWAHALAGNDPPDLVVLDEFGQLEVSGRGHMGLWPDLRTAAPAVVAIGVRANHLDKISARLERDFDIVIDAEDPNAWESLRTACLEHRDWIRVGGYGAGAGGVEIGLGSALHGVRVPGRGLILSSLQTAVMVTAGAGLGHRSRVVWVPFIAAGLKAVSPAGNRLRPMLAITMQGLLFGGATSVFGWNPLGIGLGGWLVGAWAGAQGAILQYLLVGDQLIRAYASVTGWLTEHWNLSTPGLWTAIGVWIVVWGLGAMSVGLFVHRRKSLPGRFRELMARRMEGLGNDHPASRRHALLLGAKDLARPVFWIPLLIIAAIVLAAGAPWGDIFWMAARALTVGFVVFSLARGFQPRRFVGWLRRRGHWGPAVALDRALRRHSRQ